MDSGNVLEANLVGHVDWLDDGHERKGEINDEPFMPLGKWVNSLLR